MWLFFFGGGGWVELTINLSPMFYLFIHKEPTLAKYTSTFMKAYNEFFNILPAQTLPRHAVLGKPNNQSTYVWIV